MLEFRSRFVLSFIVLASASYACGSSVSNTPSKTVFVEEDATLGAGDIFEVRVYEEKELSGKYRVSSDGMIEFPFVGRVSVAGLNPNQVGDAIAKRLKDGGFLRNPQVSVLVDQYSSKRISIVGAVAKAGTFPMTSGLTVVQAVSLAGGITAIANGDETLVTRKVDGKLKRFRVPVQQIMEGKREDFSLQAGDSVYVPERIF